MKRFSLLITFFLFASQILAQSILISALNEKITEIGPVSTDGFRNINKVGNLFSNNKILALGEVTHGIKEFGSFRNSLIKHLVTNLNYKNIILEADFSGVKRLNEYIVYDKGQVYNALIAIGTRIYNTDEYLELIEWLNTYNKKLPLVDRVKVYGADMQSTLIAINIQNGSTKLNKTLTPEAIRGLKILPVGLKQKLTSKQKDTVQTLIKEIQEEWLKSPDTSIYRQSLKTLVQSAEMVLNDFQYNRSKIRDSAMANNVKWIYELDKQPTILLAHNTHISKSPVYSDVNRSGYYLKKAYGEDYYSLGLSFYSGEFTARDEKTGAFKVFTMPEFKNKESTEYIFSQTSYPNFFLDFKSAQDVDEIEQFLKKKLYSKNIGISYKESTKDIMPAYMPLLSKFDGIVFFKNTTAATFILVNEKVKY